jgi:hypothetical protein
LRVAARPISKARLQNKRERRQLRVQLDRARQLAFGVFGLPSIEKI